MKQNCSTSGCCGYGGYSNARSFLTKDEKISMLQEYKEGLEKEAQGVEEKINQMKQG